MSEATKEKALKKLNSIINEVGYPTSEGPEQPDGRPQLVCAQCDEANTWRFNYMISKFVKRSIVPNGAWTPDLQHITIRPTRSSDRRTSSSRVQACWLTMHPLLDHRGSTFGPMKSHGFDDQGSKYA